MQLSQHEQTAMQRWMAEKGLTKTAAAKLLGVTDVSVGRWLEGVNIGPKNRVEILEHIKPYLSPQEEARQVLKELTGQDVGQGGSGMGHGLKVLKLVGEEDPIAAIERRLTDVERRLEILTSSKRYDQYEPRYDEVAEPRPHYGKDLRAYREHEAPLKMAAGGGIPNSPTLARTAILDGESMEPLFHHGEEVDISRFREPIILGQEGYMDFDFIKRLLNGHRFFFCQLGDDGLTVKGIELSPPNERGHWLLSLVAENKHWGEESGYQNGRRILRFGESLQIYGTVKKRG